MSATETRPETAQEERSVMQMMTERDGDLKVEWSPSNEAEVAEARASFDRMKGKGYTAYKVGARGERGEVIREFDPSAQKILLAMQMQGG